MPDSIFTDIFLGKFVLALERVTLATYAPPPPGGGVWGRARCGKVSFGVA